MTAPSRNGWWHGSNGGCNHRRSFWARDRETSINPSSRLPEAAPDQIRCIPLGHGARTARYHSRATATYKGRMDEVSVTIG